MVSKALETKHEELKQTDKQRTEMKTAISSLSEKLKLPVAIKGDNNEGRITISYHNHEELEKVIRIIEESRLV
jgi:hypothetical protein